VSCRQTWGEYRVFFYDDAGRLATLPADWTDAASRDPYVTIAAGRSCFRPADLLRLADLIARLAR